MGMLKSKFDMIYFLYYTGFMRTVQQNHGEIMNTPGMGLLEFILEHNSFGHSNVLKRFGLL